MSIVAQSARGEVNGGRAVRAAARRDALCFLALVILASFAVAAALPASPSAPLASAFVPVAVLVVLTPFLGRPVWTGLGLARPGFRRWPVAIGVPLAGAAGCYATASDLGLLNPWPPPGLSPSSLLVSTAIAMVLVLGEEVGWRGYLLPRLQQLMDRGNAAILTAAAHAVVHLPLILLTTSYNRQGRRWVIAPLTLVTITGAGIFYAWLRDTGHSLWPAAVGHAAGNVLVPLVLAAALPSAANSVAYVAGEGGGVTAAVMVVVAVAVLWVARRGIWRRGQQQQHVLSGRKPSWS